MEAQTRYRGPCVMDLPREPGRALLGQKRDTPPPDSGWYRKPGLLKGQIIMSDDFDAPLDDFEDLRFTI